MDIDKIVNLIFEINQLAKKTNTGWLLAGVIETNSVAAHLMRAAQIGYILSVMEGDVNPEKVACMILIHNNGKARVGDQDKVAANYFFKKEAEDLAFDDQLNLLDAEIAKKWRHYNDEFCDMTTKEAIIAQDADWLEQAFQAKEYFDLGHKSAYVWIKNVKDALQTESAQKIIRVMKKTHFTDWWKGKMKMTYNNN